MIRSKLSFPKFCSIIVSTSCFAAPLTTAFKQPLKSLLINSLTPSYGFGIMFISLNISFFLFATSSDFWLDMLSFLLLSLTRYPFSLIFLGPVPQQAFLQVDRMSFYLNQY